MGGKESDRKYSVRSNVIRSNARNEMKLKFGKLASTQHDSEIEETNAAIVTE